MGRRAKGWYLTKDPRRGTFYVRFTHLGKPYKLGTGTSDPEEARIVADQKRAEIVSGRRKVTACDIPLTRLTGEWLADLEAELDEKTCKQYLMYAGAHWRPFFGAMARMTEASVSDYRRARLREVQSSTVSKELSALRGFLAWCKERGFIEEVPQIDSPARKSTGTVVWKREPFALSEAEMERLLSKLPEKVPGRRGKGELWVKARFEVAWETGLRPETLDQLRVPDNYKKRARMIVLGDADDKNRDGRTVPLSDRARKALDRVCPPRGLIFGAHDYRAVLRATARKAKVPKADKLTEQCFRHSRATYWAETVPNLPGIQYLLGHTTATTTSKYIKASLRAALEVLEASNIGRRIGRKR